MGSGFRRYVASTTVAVAVVLTASLVSFAPAVAASSSCPTVDQQTGTVTPPPAPGVDWSGCDLDHADLVGADLYGADLSGAALSGADMYIASLGATDLSSADLTNADLTSAWLQETNLDQADLAGATLHSVYSWHVVGTPAAIPPDWRLIDGYLVGPTADLDSADLSGVDLSGMDLAGANLSDGLLSATDLAGADLKDALLYEAEVPGANLSGTNLVGADLRGVLSGDVHGTPTGIPAPWVLKDGYFFGPRADFYGAHLSGLDLSGLHLPGAYFFDARLVGTDLARADLAGASIIQTDLMGADLFGAQVRKIQWQGSRCPGGGNPDTTCARAFEFTGFSTPRPGAVLPVSPRSFAAVFKLVASRRKSAPLTEAIAHAIAAAHEVRVTLSGNGIKAVAGLCNWDAAHGVFRCRVALPRHLPTGRSHPYRLTGQEEPGSTFIAAPKLKVRTANPATIYFR